MKAFVTATVLIAVHICVILARPIGSYPILSLRQVNDTTTGAGTYDATPDVSDEPIYTATGEEEANLTSMFGLDGRSSSLRLPMRSGILGVSSTSSTVVPSTTTTVASSAGSTAPGSADNIASRPKPAPGPVVTTTALSTAAGGLNRTATSTVSTTTLGTTLTTPSRIPETTRSANGTTPAPSAPRSFQLPEVSPTTSVGGSNGTTTSAKSATTLNATLTTTLAVSATSGCTNGTIPTPSAPRSVNRPGVSPTPSSTAAGGLNGTATSTILSTTSGTLGGAPLPVPTRTFLRTDQVAASSSTPSSQVTTGATTSKPSAVDEEKTITVTVTSTSPTTRSTTFTPANPPSTTVTPPPTRPQPQPTTTTSQGPATTTQKPPQNSNIPLAISQNQRFATLTPSSTCNPSDNSQSGACISGVLSECGTDGRYSTVMQCVAPLSCYALPLEESAGISVACVPPSEAAFRMGMGSEEELKKVLSGGSAGSPAASSSSSSSSSAPASPSTSAPTATNYT